MDVRFKVVDASALGAIIFGKIWNAPILAFAGSIMVVIWLGAIGLCSDDRDDQTSQDIKILLKAAHDSDQRIRVRALENLTSYGPRAAEAVPDLCAIIENPSLRKDSFTLGQAAIALGEIGGQAKNAIPVLQRVVRDRKVSSASQAEAMTAIGKIWLQDSDPELRIRGATKLAEAGPTELNALKRALFDKDPRVRDAVEKAIQNIENRTKKQ